MCLLFLLTVGNDLKEHLCVHHSPFQVNCHNIYSNIGNVKYELSTTRHSESVVITFIQIFAVSNIDLQHNMNGYITANLLKLNVKKIWGHIAVRTFNFSNSIFCIHRLQGQLNPFKIGWSFRHAKVQQFADEFRPTPPAPENEIVDYLVFRIVEWSHRSIQNLSPKIIKDATTFRGQ